MAKTKRPASPTLNLRDFPPELRIALKLEQLEREAANPGTHPTLTDIVVEGLTFWQTHRGHAVGQK